MLYNRYGRAIFQMAMQIAQDKKNAEEILLGTFRKLYAQASYRNQGIFLNAFSLMRLVVQTAHEHLSTTGTGSVPQEVEMDPLRVSATDLKIDKLFCNCFGFGR